MNAEFTHRQRFYLPVDNDLPYGVDCRKKRPVPAGGLWYHQVIRLVEEITRSAERYNVTLVYSTKDTEHSDAQVLKELIAGLMSSVRI